MRSHVETQVAGQAGTRAEAPEQQPRFLTVDDIARMLTCSPRHVRRLVDSGRMPAPLRLGRLCRWRADVIAEWIDAGCPRVERRACG